MGSVLAVDPAFSTEFSMCNINAQSQAIIQWNHNQNQIKTICQFLFIYRKWKIKSTNYIYLSSKRSAWMSGLVGSVSQFWLFLLFLLLLLWNINNSHSLSCTHQARTLVRQHWWDLNHFCVFFLWLCYYLRHAISEAKSIKWRFYPNYIGASVETNRIQEMWNSDENKHGELLNWNDFIKC